MEKLLYFLIYLVYFSTPFESVAVAQNISVVKIVTLLFLSVAVLYFKKIPFPNSFFLKLFFIYTVYAILSTLWSIDWETTLKSSLSTTLPSFIVVLFLFRAVHRREHIDNIFKAYAAGSIAVSFWAFYLFLTGAWFDDSVYGMRLTVLGQDPNELSFLLAFGIVSILYLILFTCIKSINKVFLILISVLLAFIIMATGSRTGYVILLIIGFSFPFIFRKKGIRLVLLIMIIFLGGLLFNSLPEYTSNRLHETTEQISNRDLSRRVFIWESGWDAYKQHGNYILGTGFMSFQKLLKQSIGISASPHSTYFSTIIELGIIGLIMLLAMLFHLLKKTYLLFKQESIFYFLLIIPLLVVMSTLGTANRRWLFLIGVLIIKAYQFSIQSQEDFLLTNNNQQEEIYNNTRNYCM